MATYLLRAQEAGLNCWPLPSGRDDDATLRRVLFQQVGHPSRNLTEPDRPKMAVEMRRKGVTLVLLCEDYRAAHLNGYGYTWFSCLVDKLSRVELLVLDDWETHGLNDKQRLDHSRILRGTLPVTIHHRCSPVPHLRLA